MKKLLALLALSAALATPAAAHRAWVLPSATIVSGQGQWVTLDAAVSNDLFYFEHFPLQLNGLFITQPDGTAGKAQNSATGRYRSTFDVELTQPGTWRMGVKNEGLSASYMLNGERKRARLKAEEIKTAIPAGATEVRLTEMSGRNETFVTNGKPSEIKPIGKGLELIPVTHPNNLVAGEKADFRFHIDGKPAANLEIELVPGGNRYRDALGDMKLKTDANGAFSVTFPNPGMYWLEASAQGTSSVPNATRRDTYIATLEVLPQ
ncbi:MAG TPA: DUF4198 domain-containing protein [Rhizomicrobium sp.]|nr:DUF4198 domain-containing protein [Rhizomicrobium sp.]